MEPAYSYFECKRCFYKCNKKSNMVKHLEKKKLCILILESYKYNDDNLYDLSLQRIKNNIKTFTCLNCNKNFSNNNNLKKHIEKICNKNIKSNKSINLNNDIDSKHVKEPSEIFDSKNESIQFNNIININNININGDNNINNINNINNMNININITKSFDEEWDLSQIDINKKIILLLNNTKFTSTLENILENEVNLNVLIDNTNNTGLVYANNKLINMNVKEIVKKTMDKLYKHLNDMHNDIMNPNIFNLCNEAFSIELEKINNKYCEFIKSKNTQQNVKEYITDIYNKKKYNTLTCIEKKGY